MSITVSNSVPQSGGFDFGQSEPLTTRLRGLIRNYPKGVGIIKEFIQNADDAQASHVKITMDWRTHPAERLPDEDMRVLLGPALVIVNDQAFSKDDIENIQRIGQSGKTRASSKTGRFGLGFNSAYNVTDYPSFLTGDALYVFDPHENAIPQAKLGRKPGGGWMLDELWRDFPDLLRPYLVGGLREQEGHFDGTIFRLPLRDARAASCSSISSEPFTKAEFTEIVHQLQHLGGELLLFLKYVLSLHVDTIDVGVSRQPQELLEVTTINDDEVRKFRQSINDAVSVDHDELLDRLQSDDAELPTSSYRHEVMTRTPESEQHSTWRVVGGLYVDPERELVQAAKIMLEHDEKAVPWAGAAVRVPGKLGDDEEPGGSGGRVYCFLPLSLTTSLPVHINAFFDLDSSRQALTSDEALLGKDRMRVQWNELITDHAVSQAYAQLIRVLSETGEFADPRMLYKLWPKHDADLPGVLARLPLSVYRNLAELPVIRSADGEWAPIAELYIPPPDRPELQVPLALKDAIIPDPPLPEHVRLGLEAAGAQVDPLTTRYVRELLQVDTDVDAYLEEAPIPSLQRREWIVALLRFCITDATGTDLNDLPLALLADGKLHTFGRPRDRVIYLAGARERELFTNFPDWFVDAEFAVECGLAPNSQIKVLEMTPATVVSRINAILDSSGRGEFLNWQPDATGILNARWLALVFDYLAAARRDGDFNPDQSLLVSTPLVPDQFGQLRPPGHDSTPLMLTPSTRSSLHLRPALEAFRVPLVSGAVDLITSIHGFMSAFADKYIWEVSWLDLIDTLADVMQENPALQLEYDPQIHDRLLDFLSDDRQKAIDIDDSDRLGILRTLAIFPTQGGDVVSVADDVYLPVDYDPPAVTTEARLLKTGTRHRWRTLLEDLDARELTRRTLIENFLLPGYPAMSVQDQMTTLIWIRDHFSLVESAIVNDGGESFEFKRLIADASLIHCTDGRLRPASEIYDPRHEVVRQILGDRAAFPDMSTYGHGSEQWIDFFVILGMAYSPRLSDIVHHIDDLIERGHEFGIEAVRGSLRDLFRYISDQWQVLTTDSNGEWFAEQLRSRAWIPPQLNSGRIAIPGLLLPENRLYRPTEVELPRNRPLVASQRPIADIPVEPAAPVSRALGFSTTPELPTVLAHFDELLRLWGAGDIDEAQVDDFKRSLRSIYSFIGGMRATDSLSEDTESGLEYIRERYGGQPCLWHEDRFWLPQHAFREPVRFFAGRRVRIQPSDPIVDRGYAVLGRRNEPEIEDYTSFLDELYHEFGSLPIHESDVGHVIDVLERLGETLNVEGTLRHEVVVLTRESVLVPASRVYVADAPWYEESISDINETIHLLHPSVGDAIVEAAAISRLSTSIIEQHRGSLSRSDSPQVREWCGTWEKVLCSPEFRSGVIRLLRQQPGKALGFASDRLKDCEIIAVERIPISLFIDRDGRLELVGEAETNYLYVGEANQIFLAVESQSIMVDFLTRAINQLLGDVHLEERSSVRQMLESEPSAIRGVLDRLRVPEYVESVSNSALSDVDDYDDELGDDFADWNVDDEVPEDGELKSGDPEFVELIEDIEAQTSSNLIRNPNDLTAGVPIGDTILPVEGSHRPQGHLASQVVKSADDEIETQMDSEPLASAQPEEDGAERVARTHPETPFRHNVTVPGARSGRQPNDGSPINVQPPTRPSDSRPAAQPGQSRSQRRRDRLISYVVSDERTPENSDPTDDERTENQAIGQAAVELVLQFERDGGRLPEEQHHSNPGFDIISRDGDNARYIEVKGIDGAWAESGVPLSSTQLEFAQKHGPAFWLYVVEYARNPQSRRIFAINDPTEHVTQYRFDHGWKALALTHPGVSVPLTPESGMRIIDGEIEGVIERVETSGQLHRVWIRIGDDVEERIFKPNRMELAPADDDEEAQ